MNNATVAHKFAYGEVGRGSNFESTGISLYSYDSVLARKFGKLIVVSKEIATYSVTSRKHSVHLQRAIRGMDTVWVEVLNRNSEITDMFTDFELQEKLQVIQELLTKESKARTTSYFFQLNQELHDVNLMVKYNPSLQDSPTLAKIRETLSEDKLEAIAKARDTKFQQSQEKREERWRKEKAKQLEQIKQKAISFGVNINAYTDRELLNYDWIKIVGDKVLTSQGISVNLDDSKLLYKLLSSNVDIVGKKIGMYEIREVNDNFIKIGCHYIPRLELNRVFQ